MGLIDWRQTDAAIRRSLEAALHGTARLMMRELTGGGIEKWLGIELPKVQNLRMDLLGETSEGSLVHIELQSGNDAARPLRMAEYCLGVYRSVSVRFFETRP
jgi:hypothetical protein